MECKLEHCKNKIKSKKYQLCKTHYEKFLKGLENWDSPIYNKIKKICIIDNCEKISEHANGYCQMHWKRWKSTGDPNKTKIAPKGSGHLRKDGYVRIYDKNKGKAVPEHRKVMENHLGRFLYHDEVVHHINGVRNDNRIENLELWVVSHPQGQRVDDILKWAKEILKRYEI
jgi:hypothetical protein